MSTKFGDYYNKQEVDTAIANVDVTSQLESYALKSDVNNALELKANKTDVEASLATKLDATAYTPTDLSNYYNKQEVDAAIANVDVTSQLANYYTKSETSSSTQVNDALALKADKADVEASLSTKLDSTAYTPTDLSNYYNKQEIDAAVDLKADKTTVNTLSGNVNTLSGTVDTLSTALDTYEEVTAQSLNDLSDKFTSYYDKEFVDALIARIVQLETKIAEIENNGVNAGSY